MAERLVLLVDIGSTYAKVVVDLAAAEVLAQGKGVTTVVEEQSLRPRPGQYSGHQRRHPGCR
ncbi:MAG: hypothetical protein P8186_07905 [Anaerolineae bacterium]